MTTAAPPTDLIAQLQDKLDARLKELRTRRDSV